MFSLAIFSPEVADKAYYQYGRICIGRQRVIGGDHTANYYRCLGYYICSALLGNKLALCMVASMSSYMVGPDGEELENFASAIQKAVDGDSSSLLYVCNLLLTDMYGGNYYFVSNLLENIVNNEDASIDELYTYVRAIFYLDTSYYNDNEEEYEPYYLNQYASIRDLLIHCFKDPSQMLKEVLVFNSFDTANKIFTIFKRIYDNITTQDELVTLCSAIMEVINITNSYKRIKPELPH